jgi:hypothetical protein
MTKSDKTCRFENIHTRSTRFPSSCIPEYKVVIFSREYKVFKHSKQSLGLVSNISLVLKLLARGGKLWGCLRAQLVTQTATARCYTLTDGGSIPRTKLSNRTPVPPVIDPGIITLLKAPTAQVGPTTPTVWTFPAIYTSPPTRPRRPIQQPRRRQPRRCRRLPHGSPFPAIKLLYLATPMASYNPAPSAPPLYPTLAMADLAPVEIPSSPCTSYSDAPSAPPPSEDVLHWYVSNVSIIFDVPCLFLHHLPIVSLHFVALLCIFRN